MSKYLIELENLTKSYGTDSLITPALRGVSLKVRHGEFISIMGPSGSGKSTLMNIIGCLDKPSSGVYLFNGRNTAALSENELAEIRNREIGFVFQQFNLLQRTTALENVLLPQIYSGKRPDIKLAYELLERMGLKDQAHKFPNQLSGGQQQRVAIARALINKPSLILADEPTGSLDTATGKEIMEIFKELNSEGITVILVTHERYIAEYASRIIHLKDGLVESIEIIDKSLVNAEW